MTAAIRSARPVDFSYDRYDPKYRAPLGATAALFTARSCILADRVVSVRFEYPNPYKNRPAALVMERILDEDETWIEFPRTPDASIVHLLEWSLNREAALQDARRINSLACRMYRMPDAERWIYYEDMAAEPSALDWDHPDEIIWLPSVPDPDDPDDDPGDPEPVLVGGSDWYACH